ncbi:hypothetical protein CYLTODRAFT_338757, partial [Cylindrobasidium torrendii FP15055 ss-10]
DVLDEFNTSSASLAPPEPHSGTRARTNTCVEPPATMPGKGASNLADLSEEDLSSDFAKELAKGMEELMKDLQLGIPEQAEGQTDEEKERQLKAAWEAMLVEGMNSNNLDGLNNAQEFNPGDKSSAGAGKGDFQSKIQETMRKLKEGDGASSSSNDPDMEALEALLKDLGMGEGGDAGGNEDQIADVLEKMMGQLLSKDILYDSLKELNDKYPGYLANPPAPIPEDDRKRYEAQMAAVDKIIKTFDSPSYSDSNALEVKKIVDLMSEMQSYGSPPDSIMGPMPPGM